LRENKALSLLLSDSFDVTVEAGYVMPLKLVIPKKIPKVFIA
jgi:hypothetical protein